MLCSMRFHNTLLMEYALGFNSLQLIINSVEFVTQSGPASVTIRTLQHLIKL